MPPLMLQITGLRDPKLDFEFKPFKLGPIPVHRGNHIRITGPNGVGFVPQVKEDYLN
jgi:hypothetical protein